MSVSESIPRRLIFVDDDEDIVRFVEINLKNDVGHDIISFSKSREAWEKIASTYCDGFILDWKMPDISGLALLNRIRQMPQHFFTPIIIATGFLDLKDFRLLEEYPFIVLVEKPFTSQIIRQKIDEIFEEYQWFVINQNTIQDSIKNLNNDTKKIAEVISQLLARSPHYTTLALAIGKYYYEQNRFKESFAIYKTILEKIPQSLAAMTALGKILLKQKQFDKAASILERAHKSSPMNVERICLLGDICLNVQDFTQACEYFEEAKKIDPTNERVQAGSTLADDIRKMSVSGNLHGLPTNFAAMLNAIGISLVRNKEFAKGIDHYLNALSYVQENLVKARLAFNLGLGYLRWKKPKEALEWFLKSQGFDNGAFDKASKYVEKLKAHDANPSIHPMFSIDDDELQEELGAQYTSSQKTTDELEWTLESQNKSGIPNISLPSLSHPTSLKKTLTHQSAPEPLTDSDLEFDDFEDENLKN